MWIDWLGAEISRRQNVPASKLWRQNDSAPKLDRAKLDWRQNVGAKTSQRQNVSAPKRFGTKTSAPKCLGGKPLAPKRRRKNIGAKVVQSPVLQLNLVKLFLHSHHIFKLSVPRLIFSPDTFIPQCLRPANILCAFEQKLLENHLFFFYVSLFCLFFAPTTPSLKTVCAHNSSIAFPLQSPKPHYSNQFFPCVRGEL